MRVAFGSTSDRSMKYLHLQQRSTNAFFHWGWLMPVLLPFSQVGGRGLFNTLVTGYALWGLSSLWERRQHLDRILVWTYYGLLGAFLLSIPNAVDVENALHTWLRYALHSSAALLTYAALCTAPQNTQRLLNAMALFGTLTIGALYLLLLCYLLGVNAETFNPPQQLREDNLPFLLPFLLLWIWKRNKGITWRYLAIAGVSAVVLYYVVLSEGRAALLGLIIGLAVFAKLILNWRWRWSIGVASLVLLVGIVLNISPFLKAGLDVTRPLDAFTAGRTALWRQALQHPPAPACCGIGIGNIGKSNDILRFQLGGATHQVKHLHNFFLDAWYETGWLGVLALSGFIGLVLLRVLRVWRYLSSEYRQAAGVWLAAMCSLLAAGLFSFSYTSRQLSCYLFVCLGSLSYLSASITQRVASDTSPDTG